MIHSLNFLRFLKSKKVNFFTGVPDSLLKDFLKELSIYNKSDRNNIIASNEGSAVSIGIGHYLATKNIPCVYMQNSGLGNAINPLSSIAHQDVYSIPLLLLIGWRGGPSIKDEPQHLVKGKITLKLLNLLKIKYVILNDKTKNFNQISKLISYSKKNSKPIALVVEKNTFKKNKYKSSKKIISDYPFRYQIIETLLKKIKKNTKLISTTGYTSREVNQIRTDKNITRGEDFYLVGGMGHASSVSLGVSLKTKKKVICIDGDGSFIMHLGSLTTTGYFKNKNLLHIMFNNKSHESVGGQKVFSDNINYRNLVLSLGYKNYFLIKNKLEFEKKILHYLNLKGPTFINIKIKPGSLINLKRPTNLKKIKVTFTK
jgi:phosphonopyruvate decarboxylase